MVRTGEVVAVETVMQHEPSDAPTMPAARAQVVAAMSGAFSRGSQKCAWLIPIFACRYSAAEHGQEFTRARRQHNAK